MKILVLSDSHGAKQKLENILSHQNYDYLFFLGDGLKDLASYQEKNIIKVCGNCDLFFQEPITRIEKVNNINVMLTHGHVFKAKYLLEPMIDYAQKNNCSLLCFGHTHKQKYENINGVTVVNPGAFKNGNYAVIFIDDLGNITVKLETI